VQRLLSLHVFGVYTQAPVDVLQESVVQRLLSLHVFGVYTQPVDVLQESVVQRLLSLQVIAVYTQVLPCPAGQEFVVQAL